MAVLLLVRILLHTTKLSHLNQMRSRNRCEVNYSSYYEQLEFKYVYKNQVTLEIIDDTQYEPDEQFYVKLSLVGGARTKHSDVMLGRISIMEVTILNDDGMCP